MARIRTRTRPTGSTLMVLLTIAAGVATAVDDATGTTADAASSTTAGTILVTGTTLPVVVTETEPCALLCYNAACLDSGCAPGDFDCICDNPNSLVVKMGLCVGRDCDNSRQFDSGDWIAKVCNAFHAEPGSAVVASASALIATEIAAAAATATNNPVPSTASIDNGETDATSTALASKPSTAAAAAVRADHTGAWAFLGRTSAAMAAVGGALLMAAAVL